MGYLNQLFKPTSYVLFFSFLGTMALLSSCSAEPIEDAFLTTKGLADYSDCEELTTKEERNKCMCDKTPQYCEKFKISDEPSFAIINMPVFPGCEEFTTKDERMECMKNKISEAVKNFASQRQILE